VTPAQMLDAIMSCPRASAAVLTYLDDRDIPHRGRASGEALALVCGVEPRSWWRWSSGARAMPKMAIRLLELVTGLPLEPS